MIGVFIDKGLCYLGIHKVESWTYRWSACIQDGVCQRCGARCERLYHSWGDPSGTRYTCTRCGENYEVTSSDE